MATECIEVTLPGTRESDAARARRLLAAACATRRGADARVAVAALKMAGTWVYGSEAWERLRRAAQSVELRLHQGLPWVRVARRLAADLDGLLRGLAGEDCG